MLSIDPGDQVISEIRSVLVDLRQQLRAEETKLNELESLCCAGLTYNDNNDYSCPAWFK